MGQVLCLIVMQSRDLMTYSLQTFDLLTAYFFPNDYYDVVVTK